MVLFKTGDPSQDIREKAAQLIYILDRRFFGYTVPFRSANSAHAYGNQAFSVQLARTHPELTLPIISEKSSRFESATMVGQRSVVFETQLWFLKIAAQTNSDFDQLARSNDLRGINAQFRYSSNRFD